MTDVTDRQTSRPIAPRGTKLHLLASQRAPFAWHPHWIPPGNDSDRTRRGSAIHPREHRAEAGQASQQAPPFRTQCVYALKRFPFAAGLGRPGRCAANSAAFSM